MGKDLYERWMEGRTPSTSVPTVIPLNDWKLLVAKYLELALEYRKLGGDPGPFVEAVKWARLLYEEKMKEAANMGWLDREYLDKVGKGVERLEAILERWQAQNEHS